MTSGVSQTQSEAAVMQQTAAKFEQTNESLQKMLNDLMSELSVLESAWVGVGGTSFTTVKAQWSSDQAAIHRALAETATAIRTAERNYTASDAEAADRVARSAGGGMVLPL